LPGRKGRKQGGKSISETGGLQKGGGKERGETQPPSYRIAVGKREIAPSREKTLASPSQKTTRGEKKKKGASHRKRGEEEGIPPAGSRNRL